MSWSFNAKGPAKEVLERANTEFVSYKCVEPEQTARMSCLSVLQNLLVVWPDGVDVDIQMSGSQWAVNDMSVINSLSVKIGKAVE